MPARQAAQAVAPVSAHSSHQSSGAIQQIDDHLGFGDESISISCWDLVASLRQDAIDEGLKRFDRATLLLLLTSIRA